MTGTLIVIVGPTGSGKSDLAVEVARRWGAPIISTDSRQLFRGMAIGTAQPTEEQLSAVTHHFIASHDVDERYTAGRYEAEALALLDELFRTHRVVVAVGGSGLYVDALCGGMDALPECDQSLRDGLERRLSHNGLQDLLDELRERDPAYYEQVDRANPQRVMRALEVCIQAGRPYSELRSGRRAERGFRVVKIGTRLPREELYARIDHRVDGMMAAGLEREARTLYPRRELNALQTVGYRELFAHFDGTIGLPEAVELIKRNSRRYAKRQLTWFGRDDSIAWFDPADTTAVIEFIESQL